MKTLKELFENRMQAVTALRSLVDEAENANKEVDEQKFDQISADIDKFTKQIEQAQKVESFSNLLEQPATDRPKIEIEKESFSTNRDAREAFFDFVKYGQNKQELYAMGSVDNGSVIIPTPTTVSIYGRLAELSVVRNEARVEQLASTNTIGIGGTATAYWTPELSSYGESTPAMGQESLGAYKVTGLVAVSEEMLQDATFNVESWIAEQFSIALGEKMEAGYLVGTGTNQPTGLLTLHG